ncbi:signal peptidase I [Flavobacteriaceae bacterium Ap0902]|nr:signal peptidase I [Flavobacteriaceae bacterium Ap0902]
MWLSTWTDWFIFFIVVQIIHFAGTWHLYQKAGRKAWEAAIPIYNAVALMDIIKRPKWWVILLFLPIISPIMILIIWVDFIRSYGKRSLVDALLVIFTLGFYIYYLNYVEKPAYTGPEDRKETIISAILFAVILATTVHVYFVQPMIIPTGSMENTLRIGDALFVSKNIYGTRIPNTPVAVPFSDLFNRNLFIEKLQLPYARIPGWKKPQKNDIVVFNFPADSLFAPIDRKDNYVKRLVGEPGDVIEVMDGELFVNQEKFVPKADAQMQSSALFTFKTQLSPKYLQEEYGLVGTNYDIASIQNGYAYEFHGITEEIFLQLKNNPNTLTAEWIKREEGVADRGVYPKGESWNADFYGPLQVPQKGQTIDLTLDNLVNYIDVIEKFEDVNLVSRDGKIWDGDTPITQYTFKYDYYFMMGDNRHNSWDGRYFGFVPETYIIGQPFFLWANLNQVFGFEPKSGWKWDRWFTVPNNGEPNKTSYLWVGIIILVLFFGWDFFRKKVKEKKNKS